MWLAFLGLDFCGFQARRRRQHSAHHLHQNTNIQINCFSLHIQPSVCHQMCSVNPASPRLIEKSHSKGNLLRPSQPGTNRCFVDHRLYRCHEFTASLCETLSHCRFRTDCITILRRQLFRPYLGEAIHHALAANVDRLHQRSLSRRY